MTDNIKVIVRVRPFNSNEQGQKNIVIMNGNQVRLKNLLSEQDKKFAFHRCYWSTDNSLQKAAVNNNFVFNDIGKEVLQHIYQGYNSTIFAYGQTGSGKSYSIEGYQEKGLLQMCLQDIFQRKTNIQSQANGMSISVKVTYLQIYNEKLRDLLNPTNDKQILIQSIGNVVHIKGVDPVHCNSYLQVQKLWKDGKKIRVIGSHAMNKTSSRSHAVFTIYYTEAGKGKALKSKFNIVDLAGSERLSKTGAQGVRLQQANNINKSLTNLGIVIQTLAKNCQKKIKDGFVPYRNSLLTHILSQSLAGNSKTFMIAAISPAQTNYEETLSTLRFAQRASLVSTQTKKNVQSKQGYNKELLQQIQRLRIQLESVKYTHSVDVQYIQDESKSKLLQEKIAMLLGQIQLNKTTMVQLQKSLQQERKKKLQMEKNREKALKQAGLTTETNPKTQNLKLPYIMNISQDPTLAGMLIYHLKEGHISIGTKDEEQNDIKLNSLGIAKRHCSLIHQKGQIFILPKNQAMLFVNGQIVNQKRRLNHLDRITLGHANNFKLVIPGSKTQDHLKMTNGSNGRYGQYLDDKLNSNTSQTKNIKIFLQQIQHRIGKGQFSKLIQKFKDFYADIDEANDITLFRYKKFPLQNRNIKFRLNVIIDIQNYQKGVPDLIIICENKKNHKVNFVWKQQKFQSRFSDMQQWYSDVNGSAPENTYIQFDPWFDASDEFIKQKQKLQTMNNKQLYEFWQLKQKQNNIKYKQYLKNQSQILNQFKAIEINQYVLQSYGDSQRRGEDILVDDYKKKINKILQNKKLLQKADIYTDNVLQSVKCQQDNAFYNTMKAKYLQYEDNIKKKTNIKGQDTSKLMQTIDGLSMQNAWLNQKVLQLQDEIKAKTVQNYKKKSLRN